MRIPEVVPDLNLLISCSLLIGLMQLSQVISFIPKLEEKIIEAGFSNSNFSWTVSALSNMAIPNFLIFQLKGNYRGPIVLPQGELLPYWTLNLGAKKVVEGMEKGNPMRMLISNLRSSRYVKEETSSLPDDMLNNK